MNLKTELLETYPVLVDCRVDRDANVSGEAATKILGWVVHSVTGQRYLLEIAVANNRKIPQDKLVVIVGSYLDGWEDKL